LWVVNQRIESTGGNTLTLYNPGTPDASFLLRTDGFADHFMAMVTGIAFSDNFNFATSPGLKDANHGNGTFTGPTLWSSDPEIYAKPTGALGSHLDMLHASPFSMGIASEGDNVFWVFDGWNQNIARYDFQEDHGPGADDHGDGIVRRYTEVAVKMNGSIPSHLVLDKATGWLYVVDNGNHRVLRLDIHSGVVVDSLPLINELLEEYSQMGNAVWEVIIDSLTSPSGIELIENRLLVGDYTTGDITVYDTDNGFAKLGAISTGNEGLTGIKIGPDGAIWYTNRIQNTLVKIEPGESTALNDLQLLESITISPNPTSDFVTITMPLTELTNEVQLTLQTIDGKQIISTKTSNDQLQLDLQNLPDGMYLLNIKNHESIATHKIMVIR
jgi:hypothetical protein